MYIWYDAQNCEQYGYAVSMDPDFSELTCSLEKKHIYTFTSWKELKQKKHTD